MPKICDQECPGQTCPYEVCPFQHEYTERDEVVSGYRYISDPVLEKKIEWAKDFQKNHDCRTCPFVKNEADVGVGIIRDCDCVCKMELGEILEEMEGACV
jgi:hypothetical protein